MISLYSFIRNLKGCQFVNITYTSAPKIAKKWGLGVVTKRVSGEVQIGYSYENAVNNRLEKQGDEREFKALSLPWGVWDVVNLIIAHKGEFYLRYYLAKGNTLNTEWFVDGRAATAEEIAIIKMATERKESARQSEVGLVENQVKPNAVAFNNIESLTANHETWTRPTEFAEVA